MITKELFCAVIENLRQQMYQDRKFGEVIQEMFGCGSRCSYQDDLLVQAIIQLLQVYFPKDADGFCEIEHYCFIIEFGKIDSNTIMTAEELYDILTTKNLQQ